MEIQTALKEYKLLGEFLAPEYEQDNAVLTAFKHENPTLSKRQTIQLVDILYGNTDFMEKYFVADLLYLYDEFDIELFDSLLETAIDFKDPSFNRVFLKPCISAFGTKRVADSLEEKFRKGDVEARIGISKLLYWLQPQENGVADNLHKTILEYANMTKNLIELYHYKQVYTSKIVNAENIPNSADELIQTIAGDPEYENLLFEKLKWRL